MASVGHAAVTGTQQDHIPIKRVLISVYDKTNLIEFVQALTKYNVEIVSTGGTATALRNAGITVIDVSTLTNSVEMLHGRVKTLHPLVHGGLLAVRGNTDDENDIKTHNIPLIDMVVVNLYPFKSVISQSDVTLHRAIENIDIGGPSMIRSSSKNHAYVACVTSTTQYESVVNELHINNGALSLQTRYQLACHAFALTAEYDSTIASYMAQQGEKLHSKAA